VEAALTAAEPVLGSVVGPLISLPDDVMTAPDLATADNYSM
jgi:hypothetical protein